MIEDVEKRRQERMIKSEPRTVRRQLFQDDDQGEEESKLKAIYQERLEKLTPADEMMKKLKEETDERRKRKRGSDQGKGNQGQR